MANNFEEDELIVVDEPESYAQAGLRNIARTGARIGEQALGFPGNIASAAVSAGRGIQQLIQPLHQQYIPGEAEEIPSYEDMRKQYPFLPPTSEQIREAHQPYTGKYLEPTKDSLEETSDDIISTATALLGPNIFKKPQTAMSFLKTIGAPIGAAISGEAGKEAAKQLGAGDFGQAMTKFLFTAAPLVKGARPAVEKQMSEFYDKARNAPRPKDISSRSIYQGINKISKDLKNRDFPGKNFIEQRIKGVEDLLNKKTVDINDIWDRKIDLNNWYRNKEFWDVKNTSKPYMDELIGVLNKEIRSSGKNIPGFLENFEKGEEIFKALNKQSTATKFLSKVTLPKALAASLTSMGLGNFIKPFKLIGAAATGLAGKEASKAFDLLSNSPQAMKIYQDIMKSASKQLSRDVIKNARKLNTVAEKYFDNKKDNFEKDDLIIVD